VPSACSIFLSATASAKHEHFVMITSHTRSQSGRRQTARSTLLTWVVHLGRLKAPRKAAGHMHLLTVPSHDGADMRSRHSTCGPYQPPLATAKALTISQRQTGARWRTPTRETHGVMPNPRQVPSEGQRPAPQRSPSRKSALCKGFESMMM
jgi:hypothetical protein